MSAFQFLTTDDPEQFKNKRFLKRIRSHAMLTVRQKEQRHGIRTSPEAGGEQPLRKTRFATQTAVTGNNQFLAQSSRPNKFIVHDPSKPLEKLSRRRPARPEEEKEEYVQLISRKCAKTRLQTSPRKTGKGLDPFSSYPQFDNPIVDIWELKRRFDQNFVNYNMRTKWFPAMDGSKHAWLSTAHIKSTYADVLDEKVEEGQLTLYIKEELYRLVRQSLQNPAESASVGTYIAVGQVLTSEAVQGDEGVMRAHERGIEWMVQKRGGSICAFGEGGYIGVLVGFFYHLSYMLREAQPAPLLETYFKHQRPVSLAEKLPESPLYCPRNGFFTIHDLCPEPTLRILEEMRHLTDMFISTEMTTTEEDGSLSGDDSNSWTTEEAWNVYRRMLALPATIDTGSKEDQQLYEASLQTALLYSYAIAARLPFSEAAQVLHYAALQGVDTISGLPMCDQSTAVQGLLDSPDSTHPSTTIRHILNGYPLEDAGYLGGVLLWITLVATIAARDPSYSKDDLGPGSPAVSLDHSSPREYQRTRERAIARKSLAMVAVLCCIKIGFEQPTWLAPVLQKLSLVQDLLQKGQGPLDV